MDGYCGRGAVVGAGTVFGSDCSPGLVFGSSCALGMGGNADRRGNRFMVVDGVTAFALIHDGGGSDGDVAIAPAAAVAAGPTAAGKAWESHCPVTGPNTQLIVLLGVNCPIT